MSRSPFADKPTLVGTAVVLRPYVPSDLDALHAAMRDPEVLRHTGGTPPPEQPDAAMRTWYATRGAQADRLDLAVVDTASGACVGEVVLNEVDEVARTASFRCFIGPGGRDRGLGTEAVRLLLQHAHAALPLDTITLEVHADNPRARRVYERAGFGETGRDVDEVAGEPVEVVLMTARRAAAGWSAAAPERSAGGR